jgi:hypothetical protein
MVIDSSISYNIFKKLYVSLLYLRGLKSIIPIFLFIVVFITHLNIIDAVTDLSARYKKENTKHTSNFPADEESASEKESKGKEKIEEEEKYYSKNINVITSRYQLSERDKFFCYTTQINIHPYQDDDLQPPKSL